MKRLLLLVLLLFPSVASAQCNGVFANNTACGNISGSSNLPRPIPLSSFPANAPGGSAGNVQTNSGSGTFNGITNTQLTALINTFTSILSGAVPASGGGTTNFLRADGTWAVPPGTGAFVSGTPTTNQIAQWTSATQIQGVNLASLLVAGTGITLSGTTTVTINMGSGSVIGSGMATYTTNTTLAANIPVDDTIPQSGEGTQIMSISYTPKLSTSTLRVRFSGQVSCDNINNFVAAMFNGASNAFAAGVNVINTANNRASMALEGSYAPGSTSAQTITLRVGCNSANAALNGVPGTRVLGGASVATMVVEEIAP